MHVHICVGNGYERENGSKRRKVIWLSLYVYVDPARRQFFKCFSRVNPSDDDLRDDKT